MVERSLSMREVPGSIPGASKVLFLSDMKIVYNGTFNKIINILRRYVMPQLILFGRRRQQDGRKVNDTCGKS